MVATTFHAPLMRGSCIRAIITSSLKYVSVTFLISRQTDSWHMSSSIVVWVLGKQEVEVSSLPQVFSNHFSPTSFFILQKTQECKWLFGCIYLPMTYILARCMTFFALSTFDILTPTENNLFLSRTPTT